MASRSVISIAIVGDSKMSKAVSTANRDIEKLSRNTSKRLEKLTGFAKKAAKATALGTVALVGGAIALGKGAYDAAVESAQIAKETTRVIRTTGGAAKVSAKHVGDLATHISNLTGVDDEAVQSGENLLLTFTGVRNEVGKGNDIFDRATGLALDMSKALKTDLKSSSIQVGKALNDPVKGITALSRAGVSFTDQQKDQIKWLVASGDKLGAQKIILKELSKEFGGAAEAAAKPTDKLKVQLGNLQEQVGAYLIPVVQKAAEWLSARLPGAMATVQRIAGQLTAWWKENWPAIQATVQNVVAWFETQALPRIQAFVTGVVAKAQQVIAWWKENWPAIQETISHIINVIQAYWDRFGARILKVIGYVFDAAYQIVKVAINLIAGIIKVVTSIINGDWGKAWDAIRETTARVWGSVGKIIGAALGVIKQVIGGVVDWIVDRWAGVGRGLASALGGIASIITAPFRAAVDGVKRLWNDTLGGKGFHAPSWVPGIGGKGFEIPKLHSGGTFNSGRGEGLALLRDGETVLTPGQMAVIATGGGRGGDVIMNFPAGIDPAAAARALRRYQRRNGRAA